MAFQPEAAQVAIFTAFDQPGIIYIEQRNTTQTNVLQRIFSLFWTVCVPAGFGALGVVVFNIEAQLMHAEIRGGMCSTAAFILANTAIQLPMMFVLSACVLTPTFALGNWEWETFGDQLLLYSANFLVWESMAQCFSIGHPLVGMLNYVQNWFTSLLFCGFVFRGTEVIWPFRLFYYIMPFQWFFNSAIYNVFSSASYDGTVACNATSCLLADDCTTCERGFYCPGGGNAALQCWGPDGPNILTSGHVSYEVVTPENHFARNLIILVAQAAVYKFGFILQMAQKSTACKVPKASSNVRV